MINSCRLMADPVNRFQTKGKEVFSMRGKAKMENGQNPRVYLLEARLQLKIPEAMGGGKQVAKRLAETAIEKFKSFVPANSLLPSWGRDQAQTLLNNINATNQ